MNFVGVVAIVGGIYISCRGAASALRVFGQPPVVGAMLFSIFFGSSIALLPEGIVDAGILTQSIRLVEIAGAVGGLIFMFLVGLEIRCIFSGRARFKLVSTILVTLLPFLVCITAAFAVFSAIGNGVGSVIGGSVVTGIALGATAVPVLVLIVRDLGIGDSPVAMAAVVIAVAADAIGWIAIAVTVVVTGSGSSSVTGLVFGLVGLAFVSAIVPLVVRRGWPRTGGLGLLLLMLGLAAIGALSSQSLGVHPGLGALLAGLCAPRIPDGSRLLRTMETMRDQLLPMFLLGLAIHAPIQSIFAVERVDGLAGFVILAAVGLLAKLLVGLAFGSRMGWSMPTRLELGVLLNCRGAAEIAIASVGFHAGLIDATIFVLLFLFAILTTCVTAPLFSLVRSHWRVPVNEST